jgi:hypothetical protein
VAIVALIKGADPFGFNVTFLAQLELIRDLDSPEVDLLPFAQKNWIREFPL